MTSNLLAPMTIHRLRSLQEYEAFQRYEGPRIAAQQGELDRLVPSVPQEFEVDGYSYTAAKAVSFKVDFQCSWQAGKVNWRERVVCPITGFNNRTRGTIHLLDLELDVYPNAAIYVTEQLTPLYQYLKARFPAAVGSEYLGDRVALGASDAKGIRNEDLTRLSFASGALDAIVSLDVIEHVPDFPAAFAECARALRPGGRLLWSVPFDAARQTNLIRAVVRNGQVEHLHPPEYHVDSLSSDGVLCYQHFGWEMLEQVRQSGFRDAYALCYFSRAFGYLGMEQFIFFATK